MPCTLIYSTFILYLYQNQTLLSRVLVMPGWQAKGFRAVVAARGKAMTSILLGLAWLSIVLGCLVLTGVELGGQEDDEHSA